MTLPRAFLHHFGIEGGISLFLASEVPPGTGLGSSSTVSVALGKALSAFCGENLTKAQLAELASYVEIEKLGMPIGRQDQYAAAYGGLNAIHFSRDGTRVEPLNLRPEVERRLEQRMMLFFTQSARSAASILENQQAATRQNDATTLASLNRIKGMARETLELLRAGELDSFGELLHDSWQAKKRLTDGISNPQIDGWYDVARSEGALGGKITGAGGGGFLMLYCQERAQEAVTRSLEARGLVRMDFQFERGGAVILVDSLPRLQRMGRINIALLEAAS